MSVHTKLLAVGQQATTGWKTVYTVPGGHTTIAKHLVLCSYLSGAQAVEVAGQTPSGGLYLLWRSELTLIVPRNLDCWIVLPAGYSLRVNATATPASYSYWVSGTELLGEPAVPTVPTGLVVSALPT